MLQFLSAFSLVQETFSYFTIVCRFYLKNFSDLLFLIDIYGWTLVRFYSNVCQQR